MDQEHCWLHLSDSKHRSKVSMCIEFEELCYSIDFTAVAVVGIVLAADGCLVCLFVQWY